MSMSEKKAEPAGEPKPKMKLSAGLILGILNFVAIIAVLGFAVYSKLIYKAPPITESSEREKLVEELASPKPKPEGTAGSYQYPAVTVNIESNVEKNQFRTITVGLAFSIRDESRAEDLVAIRPKLLDKVLTMLSKKSFSELNNVKGRFVLRQEILDEANKLLGDELVTEVYFHSYVVQ